MTATSREVECAPQQELENRQLWPSSENMATEKSAQGRCRKCSLSNTKPPENTSVQNFSSAVTKMEMKRWCHHHDPMTKRQSAEWHHQLSTRKKIFKVQNSAGKVMASAFWDSEEILLVEFLEERCHTSEWREQT